MAKLWRYPSPPQAVQSPEPLQIEHSKWVGLVTLLFGTPLPDDELLLDDDLTVFFFQCA